MILMMTLALICAASLAYVLHPLMKGPEQRKGMMVLGLTVLTALGLYIAIGSPDVPTSPAIFEKAGPRFEQRLASQRELVLLEALSGAPDHVPLLLELGTVRIQAGHPQDAFEVLDHAHKLDPDNADIREALGAAHYAIALNYALQPRKDARAMAIAHFEKALAITPASAEFYARLKNDSVEFQRR